MSEIEVGEYVKTKDGIIDKVIIKYNGKCNNPNCDKKHISCKYNYYNEKDIVKHSKNILDLIEVGDFVNGHKIVMDLPTSKKHYDAKDNFVTAVGYTFEEDEIETILTKEQYNQNCYRLEE